MRPLIVLSLALAVVAPTSASGQSLFWQSRLDIFILDVDGSGETRLTNDLKSDGGPAWSPDGKQIAFSGQHGLQEIYVINTDGSAQTNLSNTPDISETSPSWSPDGKRIAYAALHKDGGSNIMVMNADGSGRVALTTQPTAAKIKNSMPAWSPNGRHIAFVSDQISGMPEIFLMDSDGGNVRALTDYPDPNTYCMNPAWSPNSNSIAFSKHVGQEADIYVMGADGSDPVPLSDYPGVEEVPAWSPDGQWLAFMITIGRSHYLYRVRPDGTDGENLTIGTSALHARGPAWSPDGKQIAFSCNRPAEEKTEPPAEALTNKYIIWEGRGLSIDLFSDEGPEFRYGVVNADGTTTLTPLTREEAVVLLEQRGLPNFVRP